MKYEICLLSQGKVLSHFGELRYKIKLFLMEEQFHLSDHLRDFSWFVKLAYLSDLNMINLNLQGEYVTDFQAEDKIKAKVGIMASLPIEPKL